ncbi:MAG: tetratricopeptide repeat protein [Planctomycetota bacterium]
MSRRLPAPVVGLLRTAVGLVTLSAAGCSTAPTFAEFRLAGQQQVVKHNLGVAKRLFEDAHGLVPEDPYNLHDLGVCSMVLAREQFQQRNYPAAMREADQAMEYYGRSINAHPGFQAALLGKNLALELKGQFEEALKHAEWAREFVGPSAKQQIFLAHELEERGDLDGALLRYRQGVAMEERNAAAHAELGKFFYRQKRFDEAVEHLQAAYRLNRDEPGVRRLLEQLGAPLESPAPR